jgi:putative membrane protein
MKYLLRVFLFHSFSLWLVSQIIPALAIHGGWTILLFAGFILALLMLLVAPILKVLFIPINIITFGLMSWAINVIVLYLLTVFVPSVTISAWLYPGFSWGGFVIPPIQLSYAAALIVVSLAVSFLVNVLHDISEG